MNSQDGGSSNPKIENRFVRIKVKSLSYTGKHVIAIFISDVTKKIIRKLQRLKYDEVKQMQTHAESYNSTICHELRTPLQSSKALVKQIIYTLK